MRGGDFYSSCIDGSYIYNIQKSNKNYYFKIGSQTKMILTNTYSALYGNVYIGASDVDGYMGAGNKLSFGGTERNSDPTEIYRYAVSNDVTQLRVRIGDGLSNSDKFLIGSAGNNAGDWTSSMAVTAGGRVGIKNDNPEFELDVDGVIRGEGIIVEDIAANNINLAGDLAANNITYATNGQTADFVFSDDYQLKDLSEVETFIKENKHLPEIPSAAEMEEEGVNLSEMNKLLLQKVEELTLYSIELEKARREETDARKELEIELEKQKKELQEIKGLILNKLNQ